MAPGNSSASVDGDVLTRERLEQLAERRELGEAPPLAAAWTFTPAEIRAVQAIEADARSANTERSYVAAARYWHAWFRLRYRQAISFPVPPATVLRFILDHVAHWPDPERPDDETYLLPGWIEEQLVAQGFKRHGAWKPNTIEHRCSVLSWMHDQRRDENGAPLSNPCRDPYVVKLLQTIRRAHAKRGRTEVRRDAATVDVLEQMLGHCAGDSLRDVRDRAVLLVGFNAGGRRRSEIAGLSIERLVADREGYLWKLGQTKTSDGQDVDVQKPIQGAAAEALREWLRRSGIVAGSVFREINRHGQLTHRPMSAHAVYALVKRLASAAGLAGAWGAHSLRSGFITQAGRSGVQMHEAMALSDHKSALVAGRYYRTGAASTSPAADLAAGIRIPGK